MNAIFFVLIILASCAHKTAPEKTVSHRPTINDNIAAHPSTGIVSAPQKITPVSTQGMETNILFYVNQHRRSIGLPPVQLNSVESSVAAQHSKNMAAGRTPFGHRGLELRMNTISRQIGPVSAVGENVAYGRFTAKEVVQDWLQSPPHKKNIEGSFTLTGIGWAKDKNGMIYYTQIFTR